MFSLVACRVLHVAAACTSFGGLLYARAVLWPALRQLPHQARGPFLAAVVRRFAWIKWVGVAVVAVTGIAQWHWVYPTVTHPAPYVGWFAFKMAGGVGLFVTTLALALPLRALEPLRKARAFWSGLNLLFAGMILTGGALMHYVH
jgi:hypothetical protein